MSNSPDHDQNKRPVDPLTSRKTERQRRERLRSENRLAGDPNIQATIECASQLLRDANQSLPIAPYIPGPEVHTAAAAMEMARVTQELVEASNDQLALLQRMVAANDAQATIEDQHYNSDHRIALWILVISLVAVLLAVVSFLANISGWHL